MCVCVCKCLFGKLYTCIYFKQCDNEKHCKEKYIQLNLIFRYFPFKMLFIENMYYICIF